MICTHEGRPPLPFPEELLGISIDKEEGIKCLYLHYIEAGTGDMVESPWAIDTYEEDSFVDDDGTILKSWRWVSRYPPPRDTLPPMPLALPDPSSNGHNGFLAMAAKMLTRWQPVMS